ncbi:tryptophan 2,3-dioxygenase [Dongia deserti]|uniref:tryptophan 2,3-dioxygenase n=1 Tax=Dongia deserti TaxID=2268030 RepID=UPI000E650252|nr:tryptophan 2,3-dioxygenase family protein [Dongia deserti]
MKGEKNAGVKRSRQTSAGLGRPGGSRETYSDFLQLDILLNLQATLHDPPQRDELLFIVIHQVSELWLKLMHHELSEARREIAQDELPQALKHFARVKAIQEQLIAAWKVLNTMTPADYLEFRHVLGTSSGFQSWGYRLVEYILGNKDASYIDVHRRDPKIVARLEAVLAEPSLYDEVLRLLARRGFKLPATVVKRDWRKPFAGHKAAVEAWLTIYRHPRDHWELYDLAEKLMDMEMLFQRWRFDHVSAVERVIGHQPGTGGSSGVAFLKKALDLRFFHDLYEVRNRLIYG